MTGLVDQSSKGSTRISSPRLALSLIHISTSINDSKSSRWAILIYTQLSLLIKYSTGLLELSHVSRPHLLAPWGVWNTSTNPYEVCSLLFCDPGMACHFNPLRSPRRQTAQSFLGSPMCTRPDKTCFRSRLNLNSVPSGLHSAISTRRKKEILDINAR